ncbi:TPR-like protein [Rhizodiscina lignyota]|uniref:TPR-like protein n=1 Tax=Rhizodiscina lignyota TaxID=1504668 RepID=A0A9P4IR13_9PEZI|nr:TPR-like protein [Rhizodiscina lignyota]
MSPSNPAVAPQLRQIIFYHLDNDLTQNALFVAGRLHALDPRNGDSIHLLALCHLRLGRMKAAYEYSRDRAVRGSHLGCSYVFAQACLALEQYSDGIMALERSRGQWAMRNHWNKHSDTSRRHVPDAAAVYALLGKLWKAHGDLKKAADFSAAALKANPFMWDAFEDLCASGVPLRSSNIFRMTPEMQSCLSALTISEDQNDSQQPATSQLSVSTPGNDPFNPVRTAGDPGLNHGGSGLLSRLNGMLPSANGNAPLSDWDTPTANSFANDEDIIMGDNSIGYSGNDPPQAPMRKTRTLQALLPDSDAPKMKLTTTGRGRVKDVNGSFESDITRPTTASNNHKRTVSGHIPASVSSNPDPAAAPQRRSARLFSQIRPSSSKSTTNVAKAAESTDKRELKKAKATGTKGRSTQVGRVVSGNRNHIQNMEPEKRELSRAPSIASVTSTLPKKTIQPHVDAGTEHEGLQWILDLFAKLGNGYYQLSRYQCQAALQAFASVSPQQRETPWVLSHIGKAYYERQQYAEAEEVFARIRKIAPALMEDMEVYSTVLWHLRKEMDLAYLSHELIDQDRLSPQSWCAIGNSFSLSRDHDQAVKCFKRATQLDPGFAYAFTLQGHEHVENEEFDKALYAYRCAISADHRHYNGWYGLGQVYEKLGKYDVAEKHYRSAYQINPTNPVLIGCIGTVLEKMRKPQAALVQYAHACDLDPKSAYARHAREKKARCLMNLRRPKDALAELEVLKDLAPDSANVHFMLGRVYKIVRDKTNAIRHFTIAMNLDPKAAPYVKEQMEVLDEDDDDYDDEDIM